MFRPPAQSGRPYPLCTGRFRAIFIDRDGDYGGATDMGVAVGTGLATSPFEGANGFWRWVQMCEEGGIDSLWQTDTLVSREPMLECMSVMAALAGATCRLKFGMNVASVGLRDPLLLAKQCATIDYLSEGRLLPAFGVGSTRSADWKATGRPTEGRGRRTDEGLEIIARLWRGEEVSFEGEYYHYDRVSISPLPCQDSLPMWIGGSSAAAIRRTARFGTGWQAAFETPEEAGRTVSAIKQAVQQAGRAIDPDHFGTGINFRFGGWEDEPVQHAAKRFERVSGRDADSSFAVGGAEEIIARIRAFVNAGIYKFVLRPLSFGDDETLIQTRYLIDEVLPEVDRMNLEMQAAPAAGDD